MVVKNIPKVVAACCVLHSICEVHGEEFDERWLEEASSQSSVLHNPATTLQYDTDDMDAQEIRTTLMNYLYVHSL